jgi:hypothetical protein
MSESSEKWDFAIWSWGSCGRGYVDVIHPVKLPLTRLTDGRGGRVKTDLFVIEYVNSDSRKNYHRKLRFIDVFQPIIIRNYGAGSCNPKSAFDNVYLVFKDNDGNIKIEELKDIEEEVITETSEDGKYQITLKAKYIVFNGNKIVINKTILDKKKIKLIVKLTVEGNNITVNGDTYDIKDFLKQRKFRFDPNRKVWVLSVNGNVEDKLAELKHELENMGVIVE